MRSGWRFVAGDNTIEKGKEYYSGTNGKDLNNSLRMHHSTKITEVLLDPSEKLQAGREAQGIDNC